MVSRVAVALLALAPALAPAAERGREAPLPRDAPESAVRRFAEAEGVPGSKNFMLQGHVARASRDRLVVRREGLPDASLRIAPGTRVRLGGDDVAPGRLREGQEVRATFNLQGSTPLAIEIQATEGDGREPYEGGTGRIRPPPQDWNVPYEGTDPNDPEAEPPPKGARDPGTGSAAPGTERPRN